MIDDEREPGAVEKIDDPFGVGGMERIRQPDVFDACLGEDLGLTKFRAADPCGAAGDLAACEFDALMGLRVWTKTEATGGGRRLHAVEISLDAPAVDQDARRAELRDVHASL
jgi:hypothetical protein